MEAEDIWFMKMALGEAEKAYEIDEVPVGAIIVNGYGDIISRAHNKKEISSNPCGHAEILAIQEAAEAQGNWRLLDCRLYVTLEPCLMCMGALSQARVSKLIFGAYDKKGGALSLGYNIGRDKRLNHQFSVVGGTMHYECSKLLSQFFKEKRKGYQKYNS